MGKPGVLLVDGEFVKHGDGSYVDICEYGNCRQPCDKGWVKCEKHRNRPSKAKCTNCKRFGVLKQVGVQFCEYCKHPAWFM